MSFPLDLPPPIEYRHVVSMPQWAIDGDDPAARAFAELLGDGRVTPPRSDRQCPNKPAETLPSVTVSALTTVSVASGQSNGTQSTTVGVQRRLDYAVKLDPENTLSGFHSERHNETDTVRPNGTRRHSASDLSHDQIGVTRQLVGKKQNPGLSARLDYEQVATRPDQGSETVSRRVRLGLTVTEKLGPATTLSATTHASINHVTNGGQTSRIDQVTETARLEQRFSAGCDPAAITAAIEAALRTTLNNNTGVRSRGGYIAGELKVKTDPNTTFSTIVGSQIGVTTDPSFGINPTGSSSRRDPGSSFYFRLGVEHSF